MAAGARPRSRPSTALILQKGNLRPPRRQGLILQRLAPLCNGSMVWSINLTAGVYCAALESLINVSGCSAIEKTQRMLNGFCPHKVSAGQFSILRVRDTKIEVAQFVKDLLLHLKKLFREGQFN
ncbi:interleukin-13 isoform X2 [Rhinopithecus roxellana]|uniref:interleukin-13 isoform X2 n=1 Tax=Rhinopithecus roxellana TaxID=61622 RepID=UPI0005332043|nr:interleukin-13 isoform X2 [Rhinopithecus roxellana]